MDMAARLVANSQALLAQGPGELAPAAMVGVGLADLDLADTAPMERPDTAQAAAADKMAMACRAAARPMDMVLPAMERVGVAQAVVASPQSLRA